MTAQARSAFGERYVRQPIERSESRSVEPARFGDTDYYSPELKFILATEYRESSGGTPTIKCDRIYPQKP